MSEYSSNTVSQLKEILESRNLSTAGKKAELIERLIESDKSNDAGSNTDEVSEESKPAEQPEETTDNKQDTENTADVAPVDGEVAKEDEETTQEEAKEDSSKDLPKKLTPEERKQLAIELLTKKIQRAEKFGDDASAEAAKKDLTRVEKFGVEPGTTLAKEIGIVDSSFNQGLSNRPFKKFRGGFKGRGFRGGSRGRGGFKPRYNNRRY